MASGFEVDTGWVESMSFRVGEAARSLEELAASRPALDGLAAQAGSTGVHRAVSLVTEGWIRVVQTVMNDLGVMSQVLEWAAATYVAADESAIGA